MRALIAAVIVAFLVGGGSAQAQDAKPRVRLHDTAPLTLRGVNFEPAEAVRLVVKLGDRTVVRKLQATRSGSFTSIYPAMRYTRCNGSLEVTASGRTGSRVSWELTPLECPTRADE
jgi:hypothetical protein